MPIPVVTNFTINDRVPFDTRLVATNSNSMYNMSFPYEGLTIYRTDLGKNFTFNGETWSVSSNGIYGGDGQLSSANTIASFGTVSTDGFDTANSLTFRAYSGDNGQNYLDLRTSFIRSSSDVLASYKTVTIESQLFFTEDGGTTALIPGPFMKYNPYSTLGYGGISFGTFDVDSGESYERLVIEQAVGGGYGLIRIYTAKQPQPGGLTFNIGGNWVTGLPWIGYGWNGDEVQDDKGCWLEFNGDQLELWVFNDTIGSRRMGKFSLTGIELNGNTSVIGGLTVNGNINVSSTGTFNIGRGTDGFGFLTDRVAFQYSNNRIGFYNSSGFVIEKNFSMTQSFIPATSTTIPILTVGAKGRIVDPKFNPDANTSGENDLDFRYYRGARIDRTGKWPGTGLPAANTLLASEDKIAIYQPISTDMNDGRTPQDARFRIAARNYISKIDEQNCAFAEYNLSIKDYDRIITFYSDSLSYHIGHRFSWYLGTYLSSDNPALEPSRWKKMGVVSTSNINDLNSNPYQLTEIGGESPTQGQNAGGYPSSTGDAADFGGLSYQNSNYSQMVIVPAGTVLKIRFDFPYNWDVSYMMNAIGSLFTEDCWAYAQSVVFVSQRIGNYNLQSTERDIRQKDDSNSGTPVYRRGSDFQWPYERFFDSTNSPLQKWGKQGL